MTTWISHVLQSIATNCCLGKCCGGACFNLVFWRENIFQTAFLPRGAFSLFAPCAFCSIKFSTKENASEIEMLLMTLSEGHYGGCHYHHSYFNNPALNIQCPPLILAPLVNMSKGGCENKSALFILFIFHSKNSQNSNLSLK